MSEDRRCNHSPGPWKTRKETGNWAVRAPLTPGSKGNWPFASIVSHVGGNDEHREGNSHLIAAAPDMLEMLRVSGVNLETAAYAIEQLGDKATADAVRRMAEQILPVISKAEGGVP